MKDKIKTTYVQNTQGSLAAWYILAMIGSAVYFVQQASGFWPVVLALLKALVWPAFLIYDLFKFLGH